MAGFNIEIDAASLRQVEYAIGRAKHQIEAGAAEGLAVAAELAVEVSKTNVAVKTGFLRDSIAADYSADKQSAVIGPQDPNAWYGVFVEWGTSKRHAEPFQTPAAEAARAALRSEVTTKVSENLKRR